jgi:hypothetical protein
MDISRTKRYWGLVPADLLEHRSVSLCIVNLPSNSPYDSERFRFVAGEARDLHVYADGSLDIVRSNSVVEHVSD